MTKNYLIFNGGRSTEPEVNDLIEQIGVPSVGEQIPYTQIEAIIKVRRRTFRWNSIIIAWRKRLEREHNILLKAVPNEGYEVLNNSGRINLGGKFFKEGLRRVGRAVKVVSCTSRDGLSDQEKKAADHIQTTGAAIHLSAQTAARQLTYPDPEVKSNGTRDLELAAG